MGSEMCIRDRVIRITNCSDFRMSSVFDVSSSEERTDLVFVIFGKESPIPSFVICKVLVLHPLARFIRMPSACPFPDFNPDLMVDVFERIVGADMTMIHSPTFNHSI